MRPAPSQCAGLCVASACALPVLSPSRDTRNALCICALRNAHSQRTGQAQAMRKPVRCECRGKVKAHLGIVFRAPLIPAAHQLMVRIGALLSHVKPSKFERIISRAHHCRTCVRCLDLDCDPTVAVCLSCRGSIAGSRRLCVHGSNSGSRAKKTKGSQRGGGGPAFLGARSIKGPPPAPALLLPSPWEGHRRGRGR